MNYEPLSPSKPDANWVPPILLKLSNSLLLIALQRDAMTRYTSMQQVDISVNPKKRTPDRVQIQKIEFELL
jgi:hypothetical protein